MERSRQQTKTKAGREAESGGVGKEAESVYNEASCIKTLLPRSKVFNKSKPAGSAGVQRTSFFSRRPGGLAPLLLSLLFALSSSALEPFRGCEFNVPSFGHTSTRGTALVATRIANASDTMWRTRHSLQSRTRDNERARKRQIQKKQIRCNRKNQQEAKI